MFCRCGCGTEFTPSRATLRRLAQGKAAGYAPGCRPKGPTHYHWKGGVRKSGNYREVWAPDHPNAFKNGYILEHRKVASEKLGRPLEPGEVVHHDNENGGDNDPDNLIVLSDSKHKSLHSAGSKHPSWNPQLSVPKICAVCQRPFLPDRHHYHRAKVCSVECRWQGNRGARKVSFAIVEEIRAMKGRESQRSLAKRFGLSHGHVINIQKNRTRQVS